MGEGGPQLLSALNMTGFGGLGRDPVLSSVLFLVCKECQHQGADIRLLRAKQASQPVWKVKRTCCL